MKIYRCKSHDYEHEYTVCPECRHQYCAQTWPRCPRCAEIVRRERMYAADDRRIAAHDAEYYGTFGTES